MLPKMHQGDHDRDGPPHTTTAESLLDLPTLSADLKYALESSSSTRNNRTISRNSTNNQQHFNISIHDHDTNTLELLSHDSARPKSSFRRTAKQPSSSPVPPVNHFHHHHKFNYDRQYLLLRSLLLYESIRNDALDHNGRVQNEYPKSNEGWWKTLWALRGRALDRIIVPYSFVVGHAVLYTCLQQLVFYDQLINDTEVLLMSWALFVAAALNSTLTFLLVFRLNRAGDRFWSARALWGAAVAKGRTLVSSLVVYAYTTTTSNHHHTRHHCDHAIRWILAFFVVSMELLRGRTKELDGDMLAGILVKEEVQSLEQSSVHMPLYVVHQIRYHLNQLLFTPVLVSTTHDTTTKSPVPVAMATFTSRQLDSCEQKLDDMMDVIGGCERIRGTPLPVVYVSHLRTILLMTLFLLPYMYGPVWQWTTIPAVALVAFVWLGIEGAASECEGPFGCRPNDLPMSGYCKGIMATTLQELKLAADRELLLSSSTSSPQEDYT